MCGGNMEHEAVTQDYNLLSSFPMTGRDLFKESLNRLNLILVKFCLMKMLKTSS